MNYDNESFFGVMDDAEAQGAEHLDEMCSHRRYDLTGPKPVSRNGPIPGCGQSALFSVPYEPENRDNGPQAVVVCAVDDAMGAMPRFGGNRLAKLSTKELFFVHGDRLLKHDPRVMGE